jgi:voltage-dependent potassium channel beta subunit
MHSGGVRVNYRRLGTSGVKLSEIGLGSWLTFGGGVDETTAGKCVRRALDLGVNFFDTADVYSRGAAETCYGRVLRDFRRRDLVIATKCFFPMSDAPNDRGLSRKHIVESIDASLKRLQLDYIDIQQCHRFDPDVELFELVRAMDDLIRQGKILYWGVSEWPAVRIRAVCALAREMHACPPVSEQPEYSIAARRVELNGVQQACAECGLGMVVWSPLRQGLLTGKYSGGRIPPDSRAGSESMSGFLKKIDHDVVDRVDRLRPIAQRRGISLAQLAIAWLLTRPAVASVIIGATRVGQVEENIAACTTKLDDADLAEIGAHFPASMNA